MAAKYKADLLYRRKDYLAASATYEQLLSVLPKAHSQVKREIEDSLVRCWLALGHLEKALSKARQLTLPPHERNATAWLLLSGCHHHLGNTEERVIALLKCASLQRYHHLHWTKLSSACRDLCNSLQSVVSQQPAPHCCHDNRAAPLCACGSLITASRPPPLGNSTLLLCDIANLFNPDHQSPSSAFEALKGVSHSQSPCSSSCYHVGECFNAREATATPLKPFVELITGCLSAEALQCQMEQMCQWCQLSQYAMFNYASSYWSLLWANCLLERATKHAESFARDILVKEMEEVHCLMRGYCWCASHVISQLFISVNTSDNSQAD